MTASTNNHRTHFLTISCNQTPHGKNLTKSAFPNHTTTSSPLYTQAMHSLPSPINIPANTNHRIHSKPVLTLTSVHHLLTHHGFTTSHRQFHLHCRNLSHRTSTLQNHNHQHQSRPYFNHGFITKPTTGPP
jgi:hypothetical protein